MMMTAGSQRARTAAGKKAKSTVSAASYGPSDVHSSARDGEEEDDEDLVVEDDSDIEE